MMRFLVLDLADDTCYSVAKGGYMDLTIVTSKKSSEKIINVEQHFKRGAFFMGVYCIAMIPKFDTKDVVNFVFSIGSRESDLPCYKKMSFLNKANNYLASTGYQIKKCACKNYLTCECHETCYECSGCEQASKNLYTIEALGNLVIGQATKFKKLEKESYDDNEELRARDAGESGGD